MTKTTICEAARAIREGRLVAFPTETVYGLGANALSEAAVEQIFLAKGRPKTSPLIVHVASIEMARELAGEWAPAAQSLAQRFWPGPLTLVVPKSSAVPDVITADLPTVALRIPAHSIALELLHAADLPIAAPSANRFTELSPTTADHVRRSFGDSFLILDGGPTRVGIESTVFSVQERSLLRPGMISQEEIEAVVGRVSVGAADFRSSPGQHPRHYRPRTPLYLGTKTLPGRGAYLWLSKELAAFRVVQMPAVPEKYAALLYGVLHDLDAAQLDWILVEPPPDGSSWDGIRDRLTKAATSIPG